MKVLYFAWLRERVGHGEENLELPDGVATVGGLVEHLKSLGGGYEAAFADPAIVRVAVNQEYVKLEHALAEGDEVAFFPPVTGG